MNINDWDRYLADIEKLADEREQEESEAMENKKDHANQAAFLEMDDL